MIKEEDGKFVQRGKKEERRGEARGRVKKEKEKTRRNVTAPGGSRWRKGQKKSWCERPYVYVIAVASRSARRFSCFFSVTGFMTAVTIKLKKKEKKERRKKKSWREKEKGLARSTRQLFPHLFFFLTLRHNSSQRRHTKTELSFVLLSLKLVLRSLTNEKYNSCSNTRCSPLENWSFSSSSSMPSVSRMFRPRSARFNERAADNSVALNAFINSYRSSRIYYSRQRGWSRSSVNGDRGATRDTLWICKWRDTRSGSVYPIEQCMQSSQ